MKKKSVLLIDHDSVRHNLALMKLSAFYKKQGWNVLFNMSLFPADKVYISKLFTFSPAISYPGEYIAGGPGVDVNAKLPDAIDNMMPDYSLYRLGYSLGHTSRGCPNQCGFCMVPRGEGRPRAVAGIYSFWNKRHNKIVIMDSNILFDKLHFLGIARQIMKERLTVRFEQGLDIRRIDDKVAAALSVLKYEHYNISWDTEEVEAAFMRNIQVLCKYVSCQRVGVHILTGYDTSVEYDYYRILKVRELGLTPFVMVYNKRRDSPIRTLLAGWANSRHLANCPFRVFMRNRKSLRILDTSVLAGKC